MAMRPMDEQITRTNRSAPRQQALAIAFCRGLLELCALLRARWRA